MSIRIGEAYAVAIVSRRFPMVVSAGGIAAENACPVHAEGDVRRKWRTEESSPSQ
jgi:hypothetical protein